MRDASADALYVAMQPPEQNNKEETAGALNASQSAWRTGGSLFVRLIRSGISSAPLSTTLLLSNSTFSRICSAPLLFLHEARVANALEGS
jgi:hypothetical protein